jgi:hypothetical protein
MAGWQQVLRESRTEPLAADQAAAIRRMAIAAAAERAARPAGRHAPIVVIGSVLVTAVTAGLLVARSHPVPQPRQLSPAVASPAVRQLQFATPGGTRIIWQFDPEFSLRETLP